MNHPIYLITGPAGSGKTSLANYLNGQGHPSIDADSTPGLGYYVNKNHKPVPYSAGADANWWASHNYVWELDRLAKHITNLGTTGGPVFVCGNAGNIKAAWKLFNGVFYLDLPETLILARVTGDNNSHNFGRQDEDPEQLVRWAPAFKAEMLELGAVTIDATQPVPSVAAAILDHINTAA